MKTPEGKSRRGGFWTTLAMTAFAGGGVVALTLPMTVAYADPPAPPPAPPAPVDPNAAPAPDSDTPPPPPEPGRINVPAGGFSYLLPAGWTAGDASRVSYGQAVLLKTPPAGRPPAADTSILLGKLDLRLYAGGEQDDQKAAIRLASDMGEFYMPFPGTRINQQTLALDSPPGLPGAAAYYEVKFTDPNKPDGQIWAAALGTMTPRMGATPPSSDRWFVVWLGAADNPIDTAAATTLAESIRPYAPPPPPPPPDAPPADAGAPGAPPADAGAPAAPPPPNKPQVGVPVPVAPEQAPGMTPPA